MTGVTTTPVASTFYDAKYFAWQQELGRLCGWANAGIYRRTVKPSDRVLDFGCGGGFLLQNLRCAQRFGIDPNPAAREAAAGNGVTVFEGSSDALRFLGPEAVDVIISNNALEHALEPWRELLALRPLLKRGGLIHFVVPCENVSWRYHSNDINQHVYSWSPQSIGNLLKAAGYEVEISRPLIHKIPPRIGWHLARLGRLPFDFAAGLWGRIARRWFQVEVIGCRPLNDQG
jgi:SAM-dependent methyltransferase